MHESSAYEAILDEGEIRGVRNMLVRLGRKRMGEPNEETVKALQAINDVERLLRLSDRIFDVKTWHELLATS